MHLNRHRGNDTDLGEVSAGNRARRPRYWPAVEWLMSSEWPRVIAIILALILVSQLFGCMTPREPCKTFACQQEEIRERLRRQCHRALAAELSEEMRAGFYSHSSIQQACHRYARRMVR